MSLDRRQVDARAMRRGLLVILIASTLLLYGLGAASIWVRRQFLDYSTATPPAMPTATPTAATAGLNPQPWL